MYTNIDLLDIKLKVKEHIRHFKDFFKYNKHF